MNFKLKIIKVWFKNRAKGQSFQHLVFSKMSLPRASTPAPHLHPAAYLCPLPFGHLLPRKLSPERHYWLVTWSTLELVSVWLQMQCLLSKRTAYLSAWSPTTTWFRVRTSDWLSPVIPECVVLPGLCSDSSFAWNVLTAPLPMFAG